LGIGKSSRAGRGEGRLNLRAARKGIKGGMREGRGEGVEE